MIKIGKWHKANQLNSNPSEKDFNRSCDNLKILSTGVLRREPQTYSSVVNVVNLGEKSQNIKIEVWDWSSYSNPIKLPVLIGDNQPVRFPYILKAKNLAVFFTFLLPEGVTFYEVRIHYSGSENVIINSFGRNRSLESQEGDTVLQHQFKEINPNK